MSEQVQLIDVMDALRVVQEAMATREDLRAMRAEMATKEELQAMRAEMTEGLRALEAKVVAIDSKETKLAIQFEKFRHDIRVLGEGIAGLKKKVDGLIEELEALSKRVTKLEMYIAQ